jgi:hypothetical protein
MLQNIDTENDVKWPTRRKRMEEILQRRIRKWEDDIKWDFKEMG